MIAVMYGLEMSTEPGAIQNLDSVKALWTLSTDDAVGVHEAHLASLVRGDDRDGAMAQRIL